MTKDSEEKMKYIKPSAVRLSGSRRAFSGCNTGPTNTTGKCNIGGGVTVNNCKTGYGAGGNCNTGVGF